MTKCAVIKQRRTDTDGRQLLYVVCPICDRRHWVDTGLAVCPRRGGTFTVSTGGRR